MKTNDDQLKTLFERQRQRDQAQLPAFERLWQTAQPALRSTTQRYLPPAIAIAAGLLLIVSSIVTMRVNKDAPANQAVTIEFDDTRLVVNRHFENMNWYSPTEPLLNLDSHILLANESL